MHRLQTLKRVADRVFADFFEAPEFSASLAVEPAGDPPFPYCFDDMSGPSSVRKPALIDCRT